MKIIENKNTGKFFVVKKETGELVRECSSMTEALTVKHKEKRNDLFI